MLVRVLSAVYVPLMGVLELQNCFKPASLF